MMMIVILLSAQHMLSTPLVPYVDYLTESLGPLFRLSSSLVDKDIET